MKRRITLEKPYKDLQLVIVQTLPKRTAEVAGIYSMNPKGAVTVPESDTCHVGDNQQLARGAQHGPASQERGGLRTGDWNGQLGQKRTQKTATVGLSNLLSPICAV